MPSKTNKRHAKGSGDKENIASSTSLPAQPITISDDVILEANTALNAEFEEWKLNCSSRPKLSSERIEAVKHASALMRRLQQLHSKCLPLVNASNGVLREQHAQINRLVRNFPRTVVIGDQCAGKSTLLSHICKEDLFPTGDGTCTFRPTVVTRFPAPSEAEESLVVDCLVHSPAGSMESKKVPFTKLSAGSWVNDKHQSVIEYLKTLHGPTQTLGILLECARRDWAEETDLDLSGDMKNVTRVEMMNKWQDLTINITFQVYNKESSAEEEGFLSFVDLPGLRTATAEKSIMNDVDNEFPFEKLFKTMASHYLKDSEHNNTTAILIQAANAYSDINQDHAYKLVSSHLKEQQGGSRPKIVRVVTRVDNVEGDLLSTSIVKSWRGDHSNDALQGESLFVVGFLQNKNEEFFLRSPFGNTPGLLWPYRALTEGWRFLPGDERQEKILRYIRMLGWKNYSMSAFQNLEWSQYQHMGCKGIRRKCITPLDAIEQGLPTEEDVDAFLHSVINSAEELKRMHPLVELPFKIAGHNRNDIRPNLIQMFSMGSTKETLFDALQDPAGPLQSQIQTYIEPILRGLWNSGSVEVWERHGIQNAGRLTWLTDFSDKFLDKHANFFERNCCLSNGTLATVQFKNNNLIIETQALPADSLRKVLTQNSGVLSSRLQQRIPIHALVQSFRDSLFSSTFKNSSPLRQQLLSIESTFMAQWKESMMAIRNILKSNAHYNMHKIESFFMPGCGIKILEKVIDRYLDVVHSKGEDIIKQQCLELMQKVDGSQVVDNSYIDHLTLRKYFEEFTGSEPGKNANINVERFQRVENAISALIAAALDSEQEEHYVEPTMITEARSLRSNLRISSIKLQAGLKSLQDIKDTTIQDIPNNTNTSRPIPESPILGEIKLRLPISSLTQTSSHVAFHVLSLDVTDNVFMQPTSSTMDLQNIIVGLKVEGRLQVLNQSIVHAHTFWVGLDEVQRFMDAFKKALPTSQELHFALECRDMHNPKVIRDRGVKPYKSAIGYIQANDYKQIPPTVANAFQAHLSRMAGGTKSHDESQLTSVKLRYYQQSDISSLQQFQKKVKTSVLETDESVLDIIDTIKQQCQSTAENVRSHEQEIIQSLQSNVAQNITIEARLQSVIPEKFSFVQKWLNDSPQSDFRTLVDRYISNLNPQSKTQKHRLTAQVLCTLEACNIVWKDNCFGILTTSHSINRALVTMLGNHTALSKMFWDAFEADFSLNNRTADEAASDLMKTYVEPVNHTHVFQSFKEIMGVKEELEGILTAMQHGSKGILM